MSGCFPESRNVYEYRDNLAEKRDMMSSDDRRWDCSHPEIPKCSGKIFDVEKFDAGFFGIHSKQAQAVDSCCRILLEKVFEAICDAGINPTDLIGTNTGVFIGHCASESEMEWLYTNFVPRTYPITGSLRSIMAHRVSYWYKFIGPATVLDTGCSSSFFALENAYKSIRSNQCDRAVVAGSNLCLHPFVTLQFSRLGVLSMDGKCKCFDDKANGYARSEALCVIILQKAKEAKRIYAQIVHTKTNADGFKEQGITYPSGETQMTLLQEIYQEANLDPARLSFLEGHGTGTFVGDPEELEAIEKCFVKNRKQPLLIGSVKSNIGHTEATSGLCSVIKLILGMENGYIFPNMNFETPRKGIESLQNGKMIIVTEKMAWPDNEGFVGINNFGFGGANCHVILRRHKGLKPHSGLPNDDLPRLVCVSSRKMEGVCEFFKDITSRSLHIEHVALIHEIFSKGLPTHPFRGYAILSKSGDTIYECSEVHKSPASVYLMFGSIDQSWAIIGMELMHFDIFRNTIKILSNILIEKNVNIIDLIVYYDDNDPIHRILVMVAVQLGILEMFKTIKFPIHYFLGSTFSELIGCYIDELLTLEEVINIAHLSANLIKKKNAPNGSTILYNALLNILSSSKAKNYTKCIARYLLPSISFGSAEYFATTLLAKPNIEKPTIHLHKNDLVVSIGTPDWNILSFQPSLPVNEIKLFDTTKSFTITRFLQDLGRLYNSGINMHIQNLYPLIKWPVTCNTPMISPLIRWYHKQNWHVTKFGIHESRNGNIIMTVELAEEFWKFISGHIIDGRNLFPATGYLNLAWQTLGLVFAKMTTNLNIVFQNVRFVRATNVPLRSKLKFVVNLKRDNTDFEITEGDSTVVKGKIREAIPSDLDFLQLPELSKGDDKDKLLGKDIYKELRLRGYNYKGSFAGIKECDSTLSVGLIEWNDNFVTFMDCMMQMLILKEDSRTLYVPTYIEQIIIDTEKHRELGKQLKLMPVYVYHNLGIIRSGGIEIRGLIASSIPRRKFDDVVLESYKFVPNIWVSGDLDTSARINVQIALENSKISSIKFKIIEISDNKSEPLITYFQKALTDQPLIQPVLSYITNKEGLTLSGVKIETHDALKSITDCQMMIAHNMLENTDVQYTATQLLKEHGFLLTKQSRMLNINDLQLKSFNILTIHNIDAELLILYQKIGATSASLKEKVVLDLTNSTDSFHWLSELQTLLNEKRNVILYSQKFEDNGILGLTNCLKRENYNSQLQAVFLMDPNAQPFDANSEFYKAQLALGLSVNVLKDNMWGTYRHVPLDVNRKVVADHVYVDATIKGNLSTVKWIQGPLSKNEELEADETLVQVCYAAINFRDIIIASGRVAVDVMTKNRIAQQYTIGYEFVGYDSNGRRVMGLLPGGLLSIVTVKQDMLMEVPSQWSMEQAITVPVVYHTVLYAFFQRGGGLKPGQTILIHSGTGGIGQAAIYLALYYHCTVFTTVGSEEKRTYLNKLFPEISSSHIGNSRDISFVQMIYHQTCGKGVDIVLNSLSEDKLLASVRCLTNGGKFFEIGKFDLASNNQLALELSRRNASFHGIMLDKLYECDKPDNSYLKCLYLEHVRNGAIKPLNFTCFDAEDVEKAFRFMATGKHMGKVIVRIKDENSNVIKQISAQPRYYINKNKVVIIIGGLGGFGLELVDWLILRGARKLIVTTRSGVKTGYQALRIRLWTSYGAKLYIIQNDLTTQNDCNVLLQTANSFGHLQAIFNLAVVLKDALFANQTIENFETSFAGKARLTKYLDIGSRELCPKLEKFVVFSSVSCGRGNAGQSNYGMSNSIMERICEKRRIDGLYGLAIQWGAVGDVGLVAEMLDDSTLRAIGGTLQQRIASCLEVLDTLLMQEEAVVSSIVVAEKRNISDGFTNMVDMVVSILGLRDLNIVSPNSTLAELGMDSMMAVEIKQALEREYEVILTPQDLRTLTFNRLREIANEKDSSFGVKQTKVKKDVTDGIKFLLRFIDDEEIASIPLVHMNSTSNDPVLPKVFFLPGVDGFASVLEPLTSKLAVRSYCLQFCYDDPISSVVQMAKDILPYILGFLNKNEKFNLVGYSYGCLVAIEVTKLLEDLGHRGNIVFIDGSPDMLSKFVKDNTNLDTMAEFETGLLCHVLSIFTHLEVVDNFRDQLIKLSSFEERIHFVENNSPDTEYSKEYLKKICLAFYKRILSILNYTTNDYKIKSKVSLIRTSVSSVGIIEDDYNLQPICEQQLEVRYIDEDHYSILRNEDLAAELNNTFKDDTWNITPDEDDIKAGFIFSPTPIDTY